MILLVELNNLKKNIMAQCVKCGNDVKPEEKQNDGVVLGNIFQM